ncbi:MAG: translocation/assembly module TamB domain-containing protein, partial [Acidobacteria bacterium]|nr:translocation/assembly module TamB domain-containing protein [Acidobacteriota bacterium]
TPVFKLVAKGAPWSFPELEGVVPNVEPYDLHPHVDARLEGPASRLVMTIAATSEAGNANGVLTGDFTEPGRRLEGALTLERFDIGRLYSDPDLKSVINGRARFDLALLRGDVPVAGAWRFEGPSVELKGYRATNVEAAGRIDRRLLTLTSGRANAYGGFATAAGTIRFANDAGRGFVADLRGRATNLNLRTLPVTIPVPKLASDIDATAYHLRYDDGGIDLEATLAASVIEGATYAAGTVGRFSSRGNVVRYGAEGRVANLDLLRYGRVLEVAWLIDPRLEGRLNGTFAIEGRGDAIETLALAARGTLTDSTIFGGELPSLDYDAAIVERRLTFSANGRFRGFDGAVIAGYPQYAGLLNGSINGRIEVADLAQDLSVNLANGGVSFDGLASLDASTVGGLRIDRATFDGALAGQAGRIRSFEIAGPDLSATATGAFDLSPEGQSNVTFEASSANLASIGELVSLPLTGAAAATGTLTGNGTELRAQGTLDGSGAGYGDYRALDLDATFTAVIPDLDYTRVTGSTVAKATMIEGLPIAITEADLTADYDGTGVTFKSTLSGNGRDLETGGRAILHPDHQEIHLSALAVMAGDQRWSLQRGDAAIHYGRGDLILKGVTLVSGASSVSVDGTLPLDTARAAGPLRVSVVNVDLAALETLLLTNYSLGGTLNADAIVTGTLADPFADGTLRVTNGSVRGYAFESLAGSVDYSKRALELDLRLQRNAAEFLTATGTVPLSALERRTDGEHVEAAEEIDLRIESSPMQLALVQAFTPYVTNVQGLADINVTVKGTIDDPHLVGSLGVKGGAFEVPELGTAYTGLDTQVVFADDRVNVQTFSLTDGNGERMRIGGSLSVHEGQLGAFQLVIESQNFEVIDNRLGDVQITSLLAVEGTLAAPKLVGNIELEAARVEVDRVFDLLGGNVYALSPQGELPPAGTTTLTRVDEALEQSAQA